MQSRPVSTVVDSDATASPGIDLLWIPLGSGGSGFVHLNGRIYEAINLTGSVDRPLISITPPCKSGYPKGALWSRLCGRAQMPIRPNAESSWKAPSLRRGWRPSGLSATKYVAGTRGSSPMLNTPWPVPSG